MRGDHRLVNFQLHTSKLIQRIKRKRAEELFFAGKGEYRSNSQYRNQQRKPLESKQNVE